MEIMVLHNYRVETIAEGCKLFKKDPIMRGCRPAPGITLYGNVTLWFPQVSNDYWNNVPGATGCFEIIYETPKDSSKNEGQIQKYIDRREIRVTFLKDKTTFHDNDYHFVGIFALNREETLRMKQCVWERICDKCDTESKKLKEIIKSITKNK